MNSKINHKGTVLNYSLYYYKPFSFFIPAEGRPPLGSAGFGEIFFVMQAYSCVNLEVFPNLCVGTILVA